MMRRMRTSSSGLELIKSFEGFRPRAVQLPDGVWTIGHSHTQSARKNLRISRADADMVLREYDLPPIEQAICDRLLAPLNQNEFDALVSFAFNLGEDVFAGSNVLAYINSGERLAAAAAMSAWRKARVNGQIILIDALVRRRAAELALFLTHPSGVPAAPSGLVRPVLDEGSVHDLPPPRIKEPAAPAPPAAKRTTPSPAMTEPVPQRESSERHTRVLGASAAPAPRVSPAAAPPPTPDEITRAISALANPDKTASVPVSPPAPAPDIDQPDDDLPTPPELAMNGDIGDLADDPALFDPRGDDEELAALESDLLAGAPATNVMIDDLETVEPDPLVLQHVLKEVESDPALRDDLVYLPTGLFGFFLGLFGFGKLSGVLPGPGFIDQNLDAFLNIGSVVFGIALLIVAVYMGVKARMGRRPI